MLSSYINFHLKFNSYKCIRNWTKLLNMPLANKRTALGSKDKSTRRRARGW